MLEIKLSWNRFTLDKEEREELLREQSLLNKILALCSEYGAYSRNCYTRQSYLECRIFKPMFIHDSVVEKNVNLSDKNGFTPTLEAFCGVSE